MKILVIRLSSIGDIVLTTPVVRCLKQQIPDAEIHFAVKRQFLPVVASNPHIDQVHVFEGKLRCFIRQLKREEFDYVVDLHRNLRSGLIRVALMKPSGSFPKLNVRKWLLTGWKINYMPPVHIVDRYFKATKKLGVRDDGKGLDYFIPKGEEFDMASLPSAFRAGYIALVIGAKHATKRLPTHKLIALCNQLKSPVILIGGKEDEDIAGEVVRQTGPSVLSYCGKLSLHGSASLVRQAQVVITHDTGLMHIAAAFRKRIISIWGNTVPEFGMSPYLPENPGNSIIVEVKGLSCRPCSKIGYDECPKKHFRCMEEQDPREIIRTVGL
jgi:ADP-heptose:LPS heptosyltransferase